MMLCRWPLYEKEKEKRESKTLLHFRHTKAQTKVGGGRTRFWEQRPRVESQSIAATTLLFFFDLLIFLFTL